MQLSLLIGKQILTPARERLGYVTGARLDRGMVRLVALAAADENEEEFFLPASAVRAYGDAVIAGNRKTSSPSGIPAPVGLPAFSETGESLGAVGDWLTEEGGGVLVLVKDGVRTDVPAACVLAGETVIVYPSPEATRRSRPKKPAKKEPHAPEIPRGSMSESMPEPEAGKTGIDRLNLLGRRVKRTVLDGAGSPVAQAGEKITPEILSLARRKNRLLALTVNTLTNL